MWVGLQEGGVRWERESGRDKTNGKPAVCSWFDNRAKKPRLGFAPGGKGGGHCGWRM